MARGGAGFVFQIGRVPSSIHCENFYMNALRRRRSLLYTPLGGFLVIQDKAINYSLSSIYKNNYLKQKLPKFLFKILMIQ